MATTSAHDLVVVANRLPVDRGTDEAGDPVWTTSPGGLVSALEPVMRQSDGAWVGWSGAADDPVEAFDSHGMHLVPVPLSTREVEDYYEGFCNATIWPLYHDVIAPPAFHRRWWEAYVTVNERFARAAADQAAAGATVWVHDYQLQLVPALLRQHRPDLRIGFFNHIPFPGYEIFAQLPWRAQLVDGLAGADLLGFQRGADANNFLRAARRAARLPTRGTQVRVGARTLATGRFPISIDAAGYAQLAREPAIRARAAEIRRDLGNPTTVYLGVDRLDYTKGIRHRLKAYGELLRDGSLGPPDEVLVQVASPSRERVAQYQVLREEVEAVVGHINGEHAKLGQPAVHYLRQSFPREEMAALYLAADVMVVTALRDGMNLVAKEYVACRGDETGALVLSEFTGAADELTTALLVNPHDIPMVKQALLRAAHLSSREAARRMRAMRRRVLEYDVDRWALSFLSALRHSGSRQDRPDAPPAREAAG